MLQRDGQRRVGRDNQRRHPRHLNSKWTPRRDRRQEDRAADTHRVFDQFRRHRRQPWRQGGVEGVPRVVGRVVDGYPEWWVVRGDAGVHLDDTWESGVERCWQKHDQELSHEVESRHFAEDPSNHGFRKRNQKYFQTVGQREVGQDDYQRTECTVPGRGSASREEVDYEDHETYWQR